MARSATPYHGINKAGATTDQYSFADDYSALIDRLEYAVRGLGAYAAGANFVNNNPNNAGKILSAAGDAYRGRIIGTAAGHDGYLIYQDNTGSTGTDRYAIGYKDSNDRLVISYVGGGTPFGNVCAYFNSSGEFLTSFSANLGIRERPFQAFTITILNDNGTIKHAFGASGTGAAESPALAYRISGATNVLTPTPLSTSPFANGAVLLSGATEVIIFDVQPMDLQNSVGIASLEYNDTGTALVVQYHIGWTVVNGVNQVRAGLIFRTHSGAVYPLTSIPMGKKVRVAVWATF